ncbi:S8 family serine peptidase [Umezawaea endophytica]|uniref:S8 family serine peptidase n=1 Tax=Umezawaea endophytica TaxID=1654476 RepID=A0A9X3AK06_9PSEU|nr:S8 family serine peptidase [Umezawaea endophytica]MCS7482235.1 S8 family serine peptidase [Umezawaea endophytica]
MGNRWIPAVLLAPLLLSSGVAVARAEVLSGYTVLVETGASRDAAIAAIRSAGGTVIKENTAVGTMSAMAPKAGFIQQVSASDAVFGAARDFTVAETTAAPTAAQGPAADPPADPPAQAADPLEEEQWGLRMVRADLARDKQLGDPRVRVGVLDSGIDGSHPDLAARLDRGLSRNFTRDVPAVDGPCEVASCVDPVDADDDGHGTHVAGIIAAAANGFGTAGVAPNVTLVNLRATQDSGSAFLQPVVDGLTYGADIGLDVINMSFFVDPWRYNCAANPNDSPEFRTEQRTIVAAFQRALDYAHGKGVTLVSSMGNNHEDLGRPRPDTTSPNFPESGEYSRPVDNATCSKMPAEAGHVLGVTALGPSQAKSDRSDYGVERVDLSAPGGYLKDYFGTPWYETRENRVLSAYPRGASLAKGFIDAAGDITPEGERNHMLKHCAGTRCAYYIFLDGTSMAAPHVSGTAALVVSQYGKADPAHPGTLTLAPDVVERVLKGTADKIPCPTPRTVSYEHTGRTPEWNATCEGDLAFNGFYGHGVVNAFAAVTRGDEFLGG